MLGSKHDRFPNAALVAFAIADDGIGVVGTACQFRSLGHAACHRQAVPQRTGRMLDAVNPLAAGMTRDVRVRLIEAVGLLLRKIAAHYQRGIQPKAGVPLA